MKGEGIETAQADGNETGVPINSGGCGGLQLRFRRDIMKIVATFPENMNPDDIPGGNRVQALDASKVGERHASRMER